MTMGTKKRVDLRSLPLALAALLLLPLMMGARGCETVQIGDCGEGGCVDEACEYAGRAYAAGETFAATDGCNNCSCEEDGSVFCTERGCAQSCGGLQGLACSDGSYCDFAPEAACGAADQLGACLPVPDACDAVYDPVCGCDGKTYGNACEAASATVSVATSGECGTPIGCEYGGSQHAPGDSFPSDDGCNTCSCGPQGEVLCTKRACQDTQCGGLAGLSCPRGSFCNYAPEAICGAADQTGTCAAIVGACTEQYDPVCGCDGKTYGNACAAASAAVSIATYGECGTPIGCEYGGSQYAPGDSFPSDDGCNTCSCATHGEVSCTERACQTTQCGGLLGARCATGEYCKYAPEARCGAADQTGLCEPIAGDVCPAVYLPVCGCDGQTYGNDCQAAAAGISVASTGECGGGTGACDYDGTRYASGENFPSTDGCNDCTCTDGGVVCTKRACVNCGGIAGLQCPSTKQFCNFLPGTQCGAADQFGVCSDVPEACVAGGGLMDMVCGCDGKTYLTACEAAQQQVSVLHAGGC